MGDLLHFPSQSTPPPPEPPETPETEHRSIKVAVEFSASPEETSPETKPESESADPPSKPPSGGRSLFLLKTTQALLLAIAVCFSVGAADSSGNRLNDLSHRLMCQCGCSQLLGECDHVGCPSRDKELGELRGDLAAGMTDQQVLDSFAAKYGAIVLAAPKAQGFDLVAWIAPFAVFAAALLGTILLIRRWGGLGLERAQRHTVADMNNLDPAERQRREQIRRETGDEGGF